MLFSGSGLGLLNVGLCQALDDLWSVHTGCLLAALDSATYWVPPGPEMGDLYPMGFPKGQPICRSLLHPPALFVFFACWDGITLKWAGRTLGIQIL